MMINSWICVLFGVFLSSLIFFLPLINLLFVCFLLSLSPWLGLGIQNYSVRFKIKISDLR